MLNKYSSRVTQPRSQGASQAMLYGIGLTDADLQKPQVGICSMWYEGNTCNMHLDRLAAHIKEGVQAAGLVGLRFNTIGVSDGLSMGTDGMSYSLPSRDLIADSIETVMGAQWYDALITVPGCDKNMPGSVIAMARLNRPSLMVYGGTIRAGSALGKPRDIISAFQSYGEYLAGTITDEQRLEIVRHSCPGAGACGGMYTANTMAVAIEALGLSLPYSSSLPAEDPGKADECRRAGAAVRMLLERDLKPKDILTRKSFENALTMIMAVGGSTNAVLHLLAIAKAAGIALSLDDFQRASDRVPLLADLKPSGKYVQEDLHAVGGTPAVMKYLLERGYLQDARGEPVERGPAQGRTADHPAHRGASPAARPYPDSVRQPRPGRRRGEDHWQGRRAVRGHCQGVRLGGSHACRPRTRGDREGARGRHSLRGAARRARDAGNADADLRDHGGGSRRRRRASDRRQVLGRFARVYHWPHHARGSGRWPDRARARWRSDRRRFDRVRTARRGF
jgi:dihydroxy-acid dehydratase